MENIINNLNLKIKAKDKIVVAVSGGPDSMLLLNLLIELRKKKDISVICAHINHGVRKASEKEKKFVEDFCSLNDIVFEYSKIHVDIKNNFHSEARKLRYRFFEHIIFKHSANYLLTAHHGDDLIETILMRITRGSSFKGYAGFKEETKMEKYTILRPLISLTKEDIISYCKKNKIKYMTDKSNISSKYTRNRFRKNILPFLKKEDNNIVAKFLKFNKTLIEANEYIEEIASKKIDDYVENSYLDLEKISKEETIIKKKILFKIFELKYEDSIGDITDIHVEKVLDLINSRKTNASVSLPHDIVGCKNYGKFSLESKKSEKSFMYKLEKNISLPNGKAISFVDNSNENGNNICRLNKEDIVGSLWVRNRKEGDRIDIKGMKGTKKVSDIFIDEKVKPIERELWPIVVDDSGNILWIPALKKSKKDKDKKVNCDIILKYH